MFCTCGRKPWKIRFKEIYNLILVLPIFETNQEVTILKKPQEEVINWYLLFATPIHHRSVMLMSHLVQSCSIREIGWEAESTPTIKFPSCVSHFMATYHGKNWALVTATWMSYWRFIFLVVATNFVKWIQNPCHWIKFHTLLFILSNRVSFSGYVRCICIEVFAMDQTTFVSAPWNSPFFLSFWSSFF